VVGGSLGGLSSALALRCVNCDVEVFERSQGAMKSRSILYVECCAMHCNPSLNINIIAS
jgi:2-polyprenyl-6-methoxyphenol hydroxylase-like FAD-dependent oxidoreductase